MQRLQHGASSSTLLGGAEKLQLGQCSEIDEPCLIADKAAPSCSRDLWEDPISNSLKVNEVTEGISVLRRDELEALPVSTAGNTDVWVMDKTLVEAINAGFSCSHARHIDEMPVKCERRLPFHDFTGVMCGSPRVAMNCRVYLVVLMLTVWQWLEVLRGNRHLDVQACQNQEA